MLGSLCFGAVGGEDAVAGTTFGRATVGSEARTAGAHAKRATRYELAEPADVNTISVYLSGIGGSGTQTVRGAVYSDAAGEPAALLGSTNSVTIAASDEPRWHHLTLATPLRLPAGAYWLALHTGATTSLLKYYFDLLPEVSRYNADDFDDGPDAVFGIPHETSTRDRQISIYASYVDTTAPSAPTAVAATTATPTEIPVTWAPSQDDVGVTHYTLDRDGSEVGSTSSTAFAFTGLACGTTYALAVAAHDAAGNRSPATTIAAATAACKGASDYLGRATVGSEARTAGAHAKRATRYELAEPADVNTISVYLSGIGGSGTQTVRGAVYSDAAGEPAALLGSTNSVTIAASDEPRWHHLTLATPLRLPAGAYWLALHTGATTSLLKYYFDLLPEVSRYNADDFDDGPDAVFGIPHETSTRDRQISIYASYVDTTAPSASTGVSNTEGTYYVAPAGSDSNPGTLAAPLATIQAGLDKLLPGDRLVIRGGTYYPRATLVLPRSGTSTSPITIESYPGENPVIDGGGRLSSVFRLDGNSWVTLDGLTLANTNLDFVGTDDGVLVSNSTDIRLSNITTRYVSEGIDVSSNAHRVTISGCEASHGVTGVHVSGHDVLVDGCRLHDLNRTANNGLDCDGDASTGGDHGGQAIAADTTTGPIEIRNNRAWNNVAPGLCWGNDGAFVELYRAQNVNVHHNSSSDGVVTFETAGDTSGIKLWRNRVRNESFLAGNQLNDILIANNTVWNTDGSHGVLIWVGPGNAYGNGSTAGLTLVNNIFASVGGMLQLARDWDATVTVDHNAYHLVDGGWFGMIAGRDFDSFADYRSATGRETNSIAADPLLVDPANDDFRVGAGSPAIAAGTAVAGVTDALTAAPDMGAVERSALSP